MIISLIIFLVSLVLLFIFVSYRTWQINTGVINPEEHRLGIDHEAILLRLKDKAVYYSKKGAHEAVLGTLKGWVITTHYLGKKWNKTSEALKKAMRAHAPNKIGVEKKEPSFFLHAISEYKAKIKTFREELKEGEEEGKE
ncbi:MAG: hypothetical protein WC795_03525 [Candidatus Paceibacterota bacterium]|jgi:hypothetical protein